MSNDYSDIQCQYLCTSHSAVSSEYKDLYVPIARDAVIRTFISEPTEQAVGPRLPLVMIHGFGAGFLQFYKNLDHLHSERRLLALDLPGFGRSTRIQFTREAERASSLLSLCRWSRFL